ncbi:MAG: SpaH/EbpB family LPXTG-anchored major pilin [Peptoniphilaceae bacterium]|nr:SpaH/EbpB family LPXTG-anchored major pilin [Peptoniphilaceae bacterium]MDY6018519.1 SpaH/EbpB family LPXTG-anchored major pilin [Anaerococcus sp.]
MKLQKFKKLSLVLVLGIILSVFAPFKAKAAGEGKITLEKPTEGETYDLYKIFDLSYQENDPNNKDKNAYSYKPATDQVQQLILGSDKYKALLVKKGNSYIVDTNFLTEENVYEFSKWLYDNSDQLEDMKQQKKAESDANIEWTNLDLGYYMIKSSAGTIVSLTSTDKEATVKEKNPTEALMDFSKKVKGGTASDFAESTYADIGENLTFKLSFTVPELHKNANSAYVLTDKLPAGLDYVSDFSIKVGQTDLDKSKYTVDKDLSSANRDLSVTFPVDTIKELAKKEDQNERTVTITYVAKLNTQASISNDKAIVLNENTANLAYDKDKSIEKKAAVKTTDFNIYKYTGENTPLKDATFKIYRQENGGEALKFSQDSGKQEYFYDTNGSDSISTDSTGKFLIKGLKTGKYYIEETKAPDGYNPLEGRISLNIEESENEPKSLSYTVGGTGSQGEDNTVKIKNETGKKLPDTGGMGRTLIYTVGAIVFFVALIILVSRNKNKQRNA